MNRRKFITVAGTGVLAAGAGCLGSSGNGSGTNGTNSSSGSTPSGDLQRIGVSSQTLGGAWTQAFNEAGRLYGESQDITVDTVNHNQDANKQITDINQMIQQDYDGILVVPWAGGLGDVIRRATEQNNIPVFAVDTSAGTDLIKSFTAMPNRAAGVQSGTKMVERVRAAYPDQNQYSVLHVRGPQIPPSNERSSGFTSVIDQNDDIEITDTLQTDWTQSDAQSQVISWVQANGPPDGIFGSNVGLGIGSLSALRQLGLAYPRERGDHVVIVQVDGGPEINDAIENGYIDAAFDQPNYFYQPLAIRQMQMWYENGGDEALPSPGSEFTAEMASIEPISFQGVRLWSNPFWAPASVIEGQGYPFVQTKGVMITQQNASESYLYGNIWDQSE